METILVVEDIDIMREDLVAMVDWEAHGCRVVGEARNGRQGLELYRRLRPDIVITDIRMPVMSGLEMIEEILQIDPGAQFVLLTMYGEFSYAKSAMQFGVSSYILKEEIDEALLLGEIERIRKKLRERGQAAFWAGGRELSAYLHAVEESLPLPADIRLPLRPGVFLVAPHTAAGSFADRLDFSLWQSLCAGVLQGAEPQGFLLGDRELLILLDLSDQISTAGAQREMHAFAEAIERGLRQEIGFAVAVAGGVVMETAGQLRTVYQRIHRLLQSRYFWRENIRLDWEIGRGTDAAPTADCDALLQSITNCLADRDYDGTRRSLRELFCGVLPGLGGEAFCGRVGEVCALLEREKGVMMARVHALPEFRAEPVLALCIEAVDEVERGDVQTLGPKVRGILRYIHEHYAQNISLADLSGHFHLSEIYISQLFKKEVGATFTRYLTEYRIKKAEELLRTGKYRIYEVTEMVGYGTVPYFSKQFRRVTGRNPSDHTG